MDEYFCPNCNAILNEQSGFDPSCGTWTCTECGKHLMDDDVYEGDTFEGVAWYCDNCNALLNRQSGFSDSYGTWTCTECGNVNGTTEDDIINNDDKFTCPNCASTLNNQFMFNKYDDDWTCTSCDVHLHHDYSDGDYSIVEEDEDEEQLECPNCGDVLKDQWCFYEYANNWTCTSCGVHLHHNYSDDPYTVVEEDDNDYGDSHSDDDESERQDNISYAPPRYRSSERGASPDTSHSPKERKLPDAELRIKRIKAFFFKRKKIQIGYDYNEFLRKNISEVRTALHNKAFSNIKIISIKDIYTDSPYKEGEVEQIVVGGSSFFDSADNLPYDTEIIITYHEKKEITIPFSSRSLHKQNYFEVNNRLQALGFTEIYEHPLNDLIMGWVKKDGSVEKVTVAGNDSFKKNTTYKYDAKIVIEYHTFKSKK